MAVTNQDMKKEKKTLIQRLRSIRMEIKILFLIVVCLTLGFGTYVIYSLKSESKALMHQHRLRSHLFGETLISGIRNIMLSGRAPYVKAFITEAREEFDKVGEIHLFNNKAEEIFPPKSPHISLPIDDVKLIETLKNQTDMVNLYPLKNETSCQVCHAD